MLDLASIIRFLDGKTSARERGLSLARKVSGLSVEAIHHAHHDKLVEAEKKLGEAEKIVSELAGLLNSYPDLGFVREAFQEFVEAKVFLSVLRGVPPPGYEELGVGPEPYLMGLADVLGELRRYTLSLLRKGCYSEAEKILGVMDGFADSLLLLRYPNAVVPGFRGKQDFVRGVVEKTRAEVTLLLAQRGGGSH